jgi:hypothetical protein
MRLRHCRQTSPPQHSHFNSARGNRQKEQIFLVLSFIGILLTTFQQLALRNVSPWTGWPGD